MNPFYYRPKSRALFRVTGEDAFTYLQSQVANNLAELRPDSNPVYTFWLNQKGKIEADSQIWMEAEGVFWVMGFQVDPTLLLNLIERHIIADDVEVETMSPAWDALIFGGLDSPQASQPPLPPPHFRFPEFLLDGLGECLIAPRSTLDTVAAGFDAQTETVCWGDDRFHFERIAAGRPSIPDDLSDNHTPFDLGPEPVGVHFDKGCYLGQEVMAKMLATGRGTRSLIPLRGIGNDLIDFSPGESLYKGNSDEKVGSLRSMATSGDNIHALALVRRRYLANSDSFAPESSKDMHMHPLRS